MSLHDYTDAVKQAAAGHWPDTLRSLAPELAPALDAGPSRKVNCPMPGHDDSDPSFRFDKPDEGRAICTCGSYDGWNLLERLRGWPFVEAVRQVGEYLRVPHPGGNGQHKQAQATQGGDHQPQTAAGATPAHAPAPVDPIERMAAVKRCQVDSLKVYGARAYPTKGAVAFPMFDASGEMCSQFNLWPDSKNDIKRKGVNAKGKPAGLFLPVENDKARKPQAGEIWFYVEGVKDCAALHGIGFQNVCGPSGKYLKAEWLPMFKGVHLVLCLNNDTAGIEASEKITKTVKGKGPASVTILTLPAAGDIRDNVAAVGAEQVVLCLQEAITQATQDKEDDLPRFVRFLYSPEEFANLDTQEEYIITDTLVRGQPCVGGGRVKTLKTSIVGIDLAVSCGSGTRFCNHWQATQLSVGFWSGESGARTIKAKAQANAQSKGVDLSKCSVHWSFDLPKLTRPDHLAMLADVIRKLKLELAIIEPVYLCWDAETAAKAGNLLAMGTALAPLTELGRDTGCTIVIIHHFRKSGQPDPDEPAGLEELSQSGLAEWARQWLLLERRTPYQADGHHSLWLRAGGSAGHAGLYAIDVDEGVRSAEHSTDWRRWDVAVRPATDARAEIKQQRENRKAAELATRSVDDCRKMLEALRRFPDGETQTVLRQIAGLSGTRAADALRSLIGEGRAELCEIKKYTRTEQGYRPTGK